MNLDNSITFEEAIPNSCKGRIYKCTTASYLDSKGSFVATFKMVLQKRKSCRGCDICGWESDTLAEDVSCGNYPLIDEIIHDGLYQLTVVNKETDWETGCVDTWNLKFIYIGKPNVPKVR